MNKKKSVFYILIIISILIWIFYPTILKKYIIIQANNHGWNLQIQEAKLKSLNVILKYFINISPFLEEFII